ncbi:hypothetical protein H0H92_015987, partial [Tricholoma furcatifolium]
MEWKIERRNQRENEKLREMAAERKRKERMRRREAEIREGLQSPGGTKVRPHTIRQIDLKAVLRAPTVNTSTHVAEATRPARQIKEKIKEKKQKAQGRKKKNEN